VNGVDRNADWTARGWIYLVAALAFGVMAAAWHAAPGGFGVVLRIVQALCALMFARFAYYAWRRRGWPPAVNIRRR
jgi:hypothetical protein